jgi:hypothetical protein
MTPALPISELQQQARELQSRPATSGNIHTTEARTVPQQLWHWILAVFKLIIKPIVDSVSALQSFVLLVVKTANRHVMPTVLRYWKPAVTKVKHWWKVMKKCILNPMDQYPYFTYAGVTVLMVLLTRYIR